MKQIVYVIIFLLVCIDIHAQEGIPQVVSGQIERIDNFDSEYVTSRNVDIWLPEDYSSNKKYAVLYMHDGQMLYDSSLTWNKQSWEVDEVAAELISKKAVQEFIVVGIWNGGSTRHIDYFPQKAFEKLTQTEMDSVTAQLRRFGRVEEEFKPQSDNYLRFMVEELKPFIDKNYSVRTDRNNTFVMGSSMGGLISMYAICEYPEVFGGAACMSTHWVGTFTLENNPIPNRFIEYMTEILPNPESHKIYFDCGDQTLDALYPEIQKKVDEVMISKGFTEKNWMTKYFPGENHTEKAWSSRLNIPMEFLLGD